MSTKSQLAQIIYNELVAANCTREEIIAEFQTNDLLRMTPAGATTYYYNCKRVATGGAFNIPAGMSTGRVSNAHDNSPDVEDERPLYTVVTPGDSDCGTYAVVASTHSFYSPIDAIKRAIFDQFVVVGLPEIGYNIDTLERYTQPA